MSKYKELFTPRYGISITIFFFILLWTGRWLYYEVFRPQQPVFSAIPATTPLIVSWPSTTAFLSVNRNKSGVTLPVSLQKDVGLLQQTMGELKKAQLLEEASAMLLFLQMNGPEGPALGGILDLGKQGIKPGEFFDAKSVKTTKYQGARIFTLTLGEEEYLTFAVHRNLLILGRFPFLVEEAIGQLKRRNAPPDFFEKAALPETGSVNLYLDTDLLNQRWSGNSGFWPPGWLEFSLHPDSADLNLKGRYYSAGNKAPDWLNGTTKGQPGNILEAIPAQFSWMTWNSCAQVTDCWPEDPGGKGKLLRDFFLPIAEPHQATVTGDLRGAIGDADRFWILEVKDIQEASKRLDSLSVMTGMLKKENYQLFEIRQLLGDQLLPPISETTREYFENPYCLLMDKFLILSNSQSGLELVIDRYMVSNTLIRSAPFLEYYEKNDQPANSWWIANPAALSSLFNEDPIFGSFLQSLEQFTYLGIHWEQTDGETRWHGTWKRKPEGQRGQSRIVWRTPLDAPVLGEPRLLKPGGREASVIAVQDAKNKLYLLEFNGKKRWSVSLDGPVVSDFHLIDYYWDGQHQLLFNTQKGIHLLDLETGKKVAAFPLALKSPASNGLTVIDTTGHGAYAYFVACENGNLYGYKREGIPLEGWNPQRRPGVVRQPIIHFQESEKDFFVALNEKGVLHVLKRNGTPRFSPIDLELKSGNPPAFQLHPRSNRIVVCDDNGVVEVISLDGQHFPLPLHRRHMSPVRFLFADVIGDDRKDYLSLSKDFFAVEYYDKDDRFLEAYSHTFARAQTNMFTVQFPGAGKSNVGTVDQTVGRIFLLDRKGKIFPGFPLGGTTPFSVVDLYGNGRNMLITGDGERVVVYELEGRPDSKSR